MSSSSSSSSETTNAPPTTTATATSDSKYEAVINSLTPLLTTLPPTLTPYTLLHDPTITTQLTTLLRLPDSGAGENHLCRWLYDTFQTTIPDLQLVVLRYVPLITGLYLTRTIAKQRPLAGFEAVLLALYAHETTSRDGKAIMVTLPDLANPSLYHETNATVKNVATELNVAVLSPGLDPHGTVRSTRRARIVGVALELYYGKIRDMQLGSKLEFCEFCVVWAGQDDGEIGEVTLEGGGGGGGVVGRKIPLPWELLQPCVRILGHCLMGEDRSRSKDHQVLYEKACRACRCLYARALQEIDPKAILATGSLLKLIEMEIEACDSDPTELRNTRVISL